MPLPRSPWTMERTTGHWWWGVAWSPFQTVWADCSQKERDRDTLEQARAKSPTTNRSRWCRRSEKGPRNRRRDLAMLTKAAARSGRTPSHLSEDTPIPVLSGGTLRRAASVPTYHLTDLSQGQGWKRSGGSEGCQWCPTAVAPWGKTLSKEIKHLCFQTEG